MEQEKKRISKVISDCFEKNKFEEGLWGDYCCFIVDECFNNVKFYKINEGSTGYFINFFCCEINDKLDEIERSIADCNNKVNEKEIKESMEEKRFKYTKSANIREKYCKEMKMKNYGIIVDEKVEKLIQQQQEKKKQSLVT